MQVTITSPSLNLTDNVSGISAVTRFILAHNKLCQYRHFVLGKKDSESRNVQWALGLLVTYLKWVWLVASNRQGVIHFNIALERRSLLRDSPLILIARLFKRRVITHIHGGGLLLSTATTSVSNAVIRWMVGSGPVVVLSLLEKEWLAARVKNAEIVVLPNTIAVDEAIQFERTCSSYERLTILYLGRISVSKGIDLIHEALETLVRKGARIRFVMAGKGPDEAEYVRKFSALLGPDFEFKGVVSGAQKTDVLKESNVFLLPSRYEGLPMALLESMAFGMIPVVTNVGSISTVVTHGTNGIIIEDESPAAIVHALEGLATQPQYTRFLSANARRTILGSNARDEYIKQLNRLYHND